MLARETSSVDDSYYTRASTASTADVPFHSPSSADSRSFYTAPQTSLETHMWTSRTDCFVTVDNGTLYHKLHVTGDSTASGTVSITVPSHLFVDP